MSIINTHNNFRARLLQGDTLVGTFMKTPSMMLAEVLGGTPLDVICLDAEHSPFDRRDLDTCLLAFRAANKPTLVRIPNNRPEYILNALDCGTTGILVPHVATPEQAFNAAKAARYGDGGRGYAGSPRAAGYASATITENLEHNQTETTVVAQIEDLPALDSIEEIAAVEGIDCLFIGVMDLTVALGASGPKKPEVIAACEKICRAAVDHNQKLGMFVPNIADVPFWAERGVTLFLMASDHAFVKQGAAALTDSVRQVCS
ncbi:MAG: aldolase/citrate lyase family protein [Pseudomonadota bacterium]